MSKMSPKAVVRKVSDLTLQYTLSEVIVHLEVTKNIKCLTLAYFLDLLNFLA